MTARRNPSEEYDEVNSSSAAQVSPGDQWDERNLRIIPTALDTPNMDVSRKKRAYYVNIYGLF